MPIQATQFTQRAQQRLVQAQHLLAQLESSFAKHDEQIATLKEARSKILDEMAVLNLPRLAVEVFEACRDRTGYGQFVTANPIARMNQEHAQLQQTIATIDADERYIRREQLIDPAAGELTHRAMKMREDVELMRAAVGRYEVLPRLIKLIDNGYDTESYKLKPWHLDYYRDWKYGDKACEALGKKRFAEVRAEYLPLRQGMEHALAELRAVERQIDEVRRLIELREQSVYRLENLPALILDECRQALKEHLEYVDREQLYKWSQGDREREAMVKKLHGIEKKIEYLTHMKQHQSQAEREELTRYIAKLQKKIAKYSRPKYSGAYLPDQETSLLADPHQRLQQRRQRFWQGYDRVVVFDAYDRYDYTRDLLWWDLMTDGRLDGDFIPEVNQFYSRHSDQSRKRSFYSAGALSTGRQESLKEIS